MNEENPAYCPGPREENIHCGLIARDLLLILGLFTLWVFATITKNILILGDKRLTFLYAKYKINNYMTEFSTANYRWNDLVEYLEVALKLHSTIGVVVDIYHHQCGYLGTVKKLVSDDAFFVPIGVLKQSMGWFCLPSGGLTGKMETWTRLNLRVGEHQRMRLLIFLLSGLGREQEKLKREILQLKA
jgi:hypothetical protein